MNQQLTTQAFLFRLMRPYAAKVALGSVVLMFNALAMLSLPQFLRRMFDHALQTGDRAMLGWLSVAMLGVVLVMVGGVVAQAYLLKMSALNAVNDLRHQLVTKLMALDVGYYERKATGELVSRVNSDVQALRQGIQFSLPMFIRGLTLGIGGLLAMVWMSPMLSGFLVVAALPMLLIGWRMGLVLRKLGRQQTDNLARAGGMLEEAVAHIRTVVAFGQERRVGRRVNDTFDTLKQNGYKMIWANATMISLNVLVGFVALIGVVWLGGLQVMDGKMSLGEMMAFLLYLTFMADAASNLGGFWPEWQSMLGGTERVVALLQQEPTLREPRKPVALKTAKGGRSVVFKGVRYVYPARPDDTALDGVELKIPAGKRVALVGPSGAGKTTMLKLMLRLDDVTAGEVLLDGMDVRQLAFADLRRQFALVAQEAPLFSGTVRDNVAFGLVNADDKDLWKALEMAQAKDFVRDLPQGLDTPVGEKGVQLSGGQRQRIALARAIAVDAPVLLLDEATSHLDSENERAVQAALEHAGKGRTVVIVAHRLSTVRDADLIVVMDKGRVAATGTHAELMKKSELYRALVELQLTA